MRIISGTMRGRKLISLKGDSIRPTTDRVRESIFNLIMDFVRDAVCLDLFGGSGALSLEAISRGAKKSTIIDKAKSSVDVIKQNIELTGFGDKTVVRCEDSMEFLKNDDQKFDIIFLDPPYNRGFVAPVIDLIVKKNLLTDEGIIVLESDFSDEHGEFYGLEMLKQRRYGRTFVTIYKKR